MHRESKKLTKASLEIHFFPKLWFLSLLLLFSVFRGSYYSLGNSGIALGVGLGTAIPAID